MLLFYHPRFRKRKSGVLTPDRFYGQDFMLTFAMVHPAPSGGMTAQH
jgi:hypothetical protein